VIAAGVYVVGYTHATELATVLGLGLLTEDFLMQWNKQTNPALFAFNTSYCNCNW